MTDHFPIHAPDDALPFGEVVIRLRTLMGLAEGSSTARHQLQNLLRKGDLTAFVFVPGPPLRKVRIPCSYWATVTTNRFRSVGYRTGSRSKVGSYLLQLTEIPGAVADSFRPPAKGGRSRDDAFFSALEQSFAQARTMLEALVSQDEFDRWIEQSGRSPKDQDGNAEKRDRGRRQKNWDVVLATLVTVLAEMVMQRPKPKVAAIVAQEVHDRGKIKDPNIPAAKTIEKQIAEYFYPKKPGRSANL